MEFWLEGVYMQSIGFPELLVVVGPAFILFVAYRTFKAFQQGLHGPTPGDRQGRTAERR